MLRISILRFFVLLLLFTFLESCSLEYYFKKGKVDLKNFKSSINFEYSNHLIIVNAELGGKNRRFLFDSGAPNVISKELQEELQLEVKIENSVKDSQGNRQILDFVYINEIRIGDIKVEKTLAVVSDLNASEEIRCLNIDGIIGANLMAKLNWEIDYKNQILTFTDSKEFEDQKSSDINLRFIPDAQKTPNISLKLHSKSINSVSFDLGSNGGFHLKIDDFNKPTKQFSTFGWPTSSLFGSGFDTVYYNFTDSLLIQNKNLGSFWVKCSKNSSRTIGNKVWENFKVQLNYSDKTIYLHRHNDTNYTMSDFGIKVKFRNNKWQIATVTIGSQAYKMGLRPGDQVLKINDQTLLNATFDDYCTLFKSESVLPDGKDISIEVIRNGEDEMQRFELARVNYLAD